MKRKKKKERDSLRNVWWLWVGHRLANREKPMSISVDDAVQVQRPWTGFSECNVMYAKTAHPDRELRSS